MYISSYVGVWRHGVKEVNYHQSHDYDYICKE